MVVEVLWHVNSVCIRVQNGVEYREMEFLVGGIEFEA
jgi:hypothetical protein